MGEVVSITLHPFYRQDQAKPVLFYTGADFSFFAPQGRHIAPIKVRYLAGGTDHRSAPTCQISSWSAQGCGYTAHKTLKIWNFTNIIATKGRVPCTIITKFIEFMRVLRLHNSAKFGCFSYFSSINDKTIWWGRFQPNFRWPQAAKLLTGSKPVRLIKWWHGPPPSCKIWWKSNDARRCERTKCDVFHFLPAGLPEGQLFRYCFTHGPIYTIFRPAGATRCTDQGEICQGVADNRFASPLPAKFHLDGLRGVSLRPQNFEKFKFYQYYCP